MSFRVRLKAARRKFVACSAWGRRVSQHEPAGMDQSSPTGHVTRRFRRIAIHARNALRQVGGHFWRIPLSRMGKWVPWLKEIMALLLRARRSRCDLSLRSERRERLGFVRSGHASRFMLTSVTTKPYCMRRTSSARPAALLRCSCRNDMGRSATQRSRSGTIHRRQSTECVLPGHRTGTSPFLLLRLLGVEA